MFPDRGRILTTLCLLVACGIGAGGERHRESRSIRDRLAPSSRFNAHHFPERASHRRDAEPGTPAERGNDEPALEGEEELLFEAIMSKDYRVPTPTEIERLDRIGDRMIARANMSEDARRVVRQIKRQRPGFFWTLARVAFETVNETRSAFEQISLLVSNNLAPERTAGREGTSVYIRNGAATTQRTPATSESTTSEEPFKLTPRELRSLVRRNLRGLARLFSIEWQDALNQSRVNVRDFQRDLANRIGSFLQDNPDVV